jgi:cyclic pyranopterin phosphate synthase
MNILSHTDPQGRATMVDVGDKDIVYRTARAEGFIKVAEATLDLIRENAIKKGAVLTVAELAGIQAAKQTSLLIPLCHNIILDKVAVSTQMKDNGVLVSSEIRCSGKTGVEMEALTAVSIALLTIYDMCKAVDKNMAVEQIRLIEKTKSGKPEENE